MRKKVLLMGKSGSGKTSMRSIIFANYIARDTRRLGPTIDVEHTHLKFLGSLVLNLWDCGGQEAFMQSYFTHQLDNIFKSVEVLIYVFDVESKEVEKDFENYQASVDALKEHSENAKIFCLIHKMDLVPEEKRDELFNKRVAEVKRLSQPWECACFATSIWDETLYKAWSKIVYQLIPNVQKLENRLNEFCNVLEADEVLLFERSTFLEIAYKSRHDHPDPHRFEKISNIVKQFKLSCSKVAANFSAIEVQNEHFSAFIEGFTSNTYVMVIMRQPNISSTATLMNIRNAKKHFESIEKTEQPQSAIVGR